MAVHPGMEHFTHAGEEDGWYKKDEVTNQFLYASHAQLYEETGNDAEAIRVNEQLLAYFQKMGSAFHMYAKRTGEDLARLRAKKMQ